MTEKKSKIYTKKILVDNEFSTPKARSERLKRLRNMANLSRKEICDTDEININTYKGWELARFGGLPVDGAEKVIKRIAKAGVICSLEWLLYGEKPSPYLVPEAISPSHFNENEPVTSSLIESEFAIFQNSFSNAVLTEVVDNGLYPTYKPGDFLAGIKQYGNQISLTTEQICIVETSNGEKLIRYVKQGNTDGLYTLLCTNYHSTTEEIIKSNVNLLYSAPISRHYKS